MRVKKLIKRFIFTEDNRPLVTLGANTRLNPTENRLQLKEDANGHYSVAADLSARTWVTNPSSVKKWQNFEVIAEHETVDGTVVTSLGYRLSDGANDYWWNGSAWVVDATRWNTEADVANNIAAFPMASQKLQVVINLVTTNAAYTPKVEMIKVLYDSDVEFQDDLINRSLIPALKAAVRPIADFPFDTVSNSAKIDLAETYKLETPYNVVGIDSVYNHTADPKHLVDLLSSYDANTKVITLNAPIPAGKRLWVRFYYEPEVSVRTSQDYHEVDKVPAIHLEVSLAKTTELSQDDTVINRATGAGTRVKAPSKGDLEVSLQFLTDKARDHHILADELKRFFGENQFITSKGMDEKYRMRLLGEYQDQSSITQKELHTGRLRFRICDALFFNKAAVAVFSVKEFHATGDMNFVVE